MFSDYGYGLPGIYGYGPDHYGDSFSGWSYPGLLVPPYFLDSQKRGEALPVYLNDRQLKVLRDRSRRLCSENEFAISALENRVSYIVGSGFTYRVLPAHDETANDSLIKQTQRVVDIFVEANRLSQLAGEFINRDDRDGETFIRFFPQDSGLLLVRYVEPEHVRSPTGGTTAQDSFGIETDPKDVMSIRGYWVIQEPLYNSTPEFVKAQFILHSKRNTDSGAKRGIPLFYPVESNLRRAEEILAAASSTVKARAKIALIRHIEGSSRTAAERLKTELETGQTFDPTTGGPTNVEQLKLGTVMTSSKNISYEFPDSGNMVGVVDILKAELRAVAARLVMPEAMLTADPGGGTYSSQLVAEAPATRNFERLQRYYRDLLAESRAPGHESLIWRQIAYAVKCGLLPREALTDVKVIADAPHIIARDPDKASAASKVYYDMGAISPQIICQQLGLNWDQVQRDRKAAGLPDPNQMAMGGGMPGDLGSTVPALPPAGGEEQAAGGEPAVAGQGQESSGGEFEFDSSVFEGL